jgi:hypothetical protein
MLAEYENTSMSIGLQVSIMLLVDGVQSRMNFWFAKDEMTPAFLYSFTTGEDFELSKGLFLQCSHKNKVQTDACLSR